MLRDKRPHLNILVTSAFSVNILLIFITLINVQKLVSASCIFTDGQIGECVKFEECRSAVVLSQKGVNPGFCSLEENTVCCVDFRGTSQIEKGPFSEVQSSYSRKWSSQTSNSGVSNVNAKDSFEYDLNVQRKKHSIGINNGNNYGKKKTNADIIEEPYKFETPSAFWSDTEFTSKPVSRPSQPKIGQNEENYFIPPGLGKKKPWRDEKTTENEYYYEHVTKKSGRGPNRKGPNKQTGNNYESNNSHKWGDINTTRRPERTDQGGRKTTNDWSNVQNEFESDYFNQRTTPKRNNWQQETYSTTSRPDYFGGGGGNNYAGNEYSNVKPNRRPQTPPPNRPNFQGSSASGNKPPINQQNSNFEGNRPTYQQGSNFEGNRPTYQQGSNFEGNRPTYQQGFKDPNSRPGFQKNSRISEQKCEEYSKQVTENITGLPLTTHPDPVTIPVRKCITPQQLIVGGENTTLGEFPHMAAIGFRDRNKKQIAWNCGGSLISELFVMTAAHCTSTSSGRPVKVRLGEYNLMKNDDGAYPVDYAIVEIVTHPEYRPPSKYNDIALLKLSRKVTFFKHIRPACLYLEDTFSASKAIATGWGRMYYGKTPKTRALVKFRRHAMIYFRCRNCLIQNLLSDGGTSEILQKVILSIIDNFTCNRLYKINVKTEVLSKGIVSSQLCAGELTGGKDTCQGDSGGPLSITSTKCIHHIIGITSFGKSCALPNSTGVYTRVSAYVPWIESVVWPS